MPNSLKAALWWAVAILAAVWAFQTPNAIPGITAAWDQLMNAILSVLGAILDGLNHILPK